MEDGKNEAIPPTSILDPFQKGAAVEEKERRFEKGMQP